MNKYIKFTLLHIFLGYLFAFFYAQTTIPAFTEYSLKIRNIKGEKDFELPDRGTYLLKIWGDNSYDKVFVNSLPITHSVFRKRPKLMEFYYVLAPNLTKKGTNTFKTIPPHRCSFRIKNCISATGFGIVNFKTVTPQRTPLSSGEYTLILLAFVVFGCAFLLFLQRFLRFPFGTFFLKYTLSFLPCIAFLSFAMNLSSFVPFQFSFFKNSFWGLCAFLIAIFQVPLLWSFFIREGFVYAVKQSDEKIRLLKDATRIITVSASDFIHASRKKVLETGEQSARKFVESWPVQWWLAQKFSDKCVIFFIAALFLCAFLLTFGFESLTEFLANLAYAALVTAVIIKYKKSKTA